MNKIAIKTIALILILAFTQCSKLGFVERRYNKGHYREGKNSVSTRTHNEKKEENKNTPEETKKESVVINTEKKGFGSTDTTTNELITKHKKEIKIKSKAIDLNIISRIHKKDFEERKARAFASMPITKSLLAKQEKAKANGGDGSSVATMILSIVGFAAAIIGFLSVFYGIIDTFIALINELSYLSPMFAVAIVLGVAALACGITTLVLGKGELESFQRSFAILAIVFGAVAIVLALLWIMIFSLM